MLECASSAVVCSIIESFIILQVAIIAVGHALHIPLSYLAVTPIMPDITYHHVLSGPALFALGQARLQQNHQ